MESPGGLEMVEPVSRGSPVRRSTVDLRIRYAETDQMGKAHHMNYLSWLECGRSELLRANGISYAELERAGVQLRVTSVGIEHRQSAGYDEEVRVWTDLGEVRSCTLTFSHEVRRAVDGGLLARGHAAVVCTDRDGRTRSIPGRIVRSLVG